MTCVRHFLTLSRPLSHLNSQAEPERIHRRHERHGRLLRTDHPQSGSPPAHTHRSRPRGHGSLSKTRDHPPVCRFPGAFRWRRRRRRRCGRYQISKRRWGLRGRGGIAITDVVVLYVPVLHVPAHEDGKDAAEAGWAERQALPGSVTVENLKIGFGGVRRLHFVSNEIGSSEHLTTQGLGIDVHSQIYQDQIAPIPFM